MQDAHEEVGDAEQHGVVAEGARHRERGDEHRGDRGEHRQPDAALVDVDRARQPRVDGPRPPERGENEHPAEHAAPRRVVDEQARDLGHREHEDEVEEELERGDLVLRVGLELAVGVGHARTLVQLLCNQGGQLGRRDTVPAGHDARAAIATRSRRGHALAPRPVSPGDDHPGRRRTCHRVPRRRREPTVRGRAGTGGLGRAGRARAPRCECRASSPTRRSPSSSWTIPTPCLSRVRGAAKAGRSRRAAASRRRPACARALAGGRVSARSRTRARGR